MSERPQDLQARWGVPPMSRRRFLEVGGGAVGGAVLLGACGSGATSTKAQAKPGQAAQSTKLASSIVVGTTVSNPTLNPLNDQYATYQFAAFNSLTYLAPGQAAQPSLATSWSRTNDTTWVFHLRPGVLFHDGTQMTAKDVEFSFNTIVSNHYGNFPTIITIASVTATDASTVQIVTKAPDPLLLDRVSQIPVVPQAYWEKVGPQQFAQKPIGTGPYKITSFTPNVATTYEAFPQYWGTKPLTPKVTINDFQDPGSLLAAFQAGQMDVAHYLDTSAMVTVKDPSLVVSSAPAAQTNMVQINTTKGPWADPRVRQAANMAVDVKGMVAALEHGYATIEDGQLSNSLIYGYNPSVHRPAYDPAKAKQLLAQAGYPNGFSTSLTGLQLLKTFLDGLAGQLRKVGINCQVNALEVNAWLPQFLKGTEAPLFQRGLAWTGIYDADRAYQYIQLAPPDITSVSDPQWEALFSSERSDLNPTSRLATLKQCASYVNQHDYILWTYGAATVGGWKKGVSGVDLRTGVMLEIAKIGKAA